MLPLVNSLIQVFKIFWSNAFCFSSNVSGSGEDARIISCSTSDGSSSSSSSLSRIDSRKASSSPEPLDFFCDIRDQNESRDDMVLARGVTPSESERGVEVPDEMVDVGDDGLNS